MKDRSKIIAAILFVLGSSQMVGDLLNIPALKGVGAATLLAPAPKVFSSVQGLETFSSRFELEWRDAVDETHTLVLTPEVYARVLGPYNRRNVYGAVLAYGPVLPPALRDPVLVYGLCGRGPLLRELNVAPEGISALRIRLVPRAGSRHSPELVLAREIDCP